MDDTMTKQASALVSGRKVVQAQKQALMFDPWLTTSSLIVEGMIKNLRGYYRNEVLTGRRTGGVLRKKRARKARDASNFERIFQAIYVNLAYAEACGGEPPAVAVSLRASRQALTRYDASGFGMLPRILEDLSIRRMCLALVKSKQRGIASSIYSGLGPLQLVRPEHFGRHEGSEVIRLSRTAPHPYAEGAEDSRERHEGSLLVDYTDTPETNRLREEMQRINRHLAGAKLGFEGEQHLRMGVFAQRELRRYFKLPDGESERFDLCGRMFGGWWQSLPKGNRGHIRIDGETVADLDFRSMFLRLAYIRAGLPAPSAGDLYVGTWGDIGPEGSEGLREGIKKFVNAMFFRETPLAKFPKLTKDLFPRGASAAEVRDGILKAHAPIAHLFETGIGLSLMFAESQVLTAILLRLNGEGITALPMHDGLMVAASKLGAARRAMEETAEAITGFKLPITARILRA